MGTPLDPLGDDVEGQRQIRKIAEALYRRGITDEEVGKLKRISMWQGLTKDDDGEAHIHDLHGFELHPSWNEGPAWQPVDQGPAVKVTPPRRAAKATDVSSVVILPDMQCGYYRDDEGLQPTHDEAAVDAAVALIRDVQPSSVVMLGDNADFVDFGRYRRSAAFALTAQETINYLTVLMGRLRAAAGPDAEIVWIEGNHEARLPNWLMDNASVAYGLRRGMDPAGWPVMSIPYLCRLDDVGVTYLPGYPAAEHWITPTLRCIHGSKVRSGSTAHAYLPELQSSVLYGHVHRVEEAWMAKRTVEGSVTVMAASPGTLARVDGVVPSQGQGLDLDGRPLPSTENWQQGLAVVDVHPDESWTYTSIRLVNGYAYYNGKWYGPEQAP